MFKLVSWSTTQPYPIFASSSISVKESLETTTQSVLNSSNNPSSYSLMLGDQYSWNGSLGNNDIKSGFEKVYGPNIFNKNDRDSGGYLDFATIILVLVLLLIIIGTVIGNILVCVAVCLVRKLRRPYNYLLVSLAVSDLCVALLVMPMAMVYEFLGEWKFGSTVCDIWVSFDVLSCTASILNLCMISVDRYLAITKPLEYGVKRTPRRMMAYILFVWLGAAFVSVPPVLILGNEHGNGTMCIVCQNFWYQIYATFGSFYIPLGVMLTVYYKIFRAAKRIVNEEKKAQAHLRQVDEDEVKYSKMNSVPTYTQQLPISR